MIRKPTHRNGMILVLVLIVIALISLAAYTFTEMMLAEEEAALLAGQQTQAQCLADSGVEMCRLYLAQSQQAQQDAGGHYDNPTRFQGVLVADDGTPQGRGRFSIIAPLFQDGNPPGLRFGLEDESCRLNLNMLLSADKITPNGGRTLLMGLPGMTEELADAILDYIDEDDEPREFGAEMDEYTALEPPYAPKNGPLDTVEELLLVVGMTPYLLFGTDANRNGLADMHEGMAVEETTDGTENRGWAGYLTLYSMEGNLNAQGTPRIYLNGDDLQKLHDEVSAIGGQEWATFIIAFRQFGASTSTGGTGGSGGSGEAQQVASRKPDLSMNGSTLKYPGSKKINNVLDLIGAKVSANLEGEKEKVTIASPFPNDVLAMNVYLPKLMDSFTATGQDKLPARININQAPRHVIMGIPGMDEETADKIISEREANPPPERPHRRFETWIMSEGLVKLEQMKTFMPFICAGGGVYRAQVIGYFDDSGPSARVEAILDATNGPPRLLFWRNISHLGRGYPLEVLGVAVQ